MSRTRQNALAGANPGVVTRPRSRLSRRRHGRPSGLPRRAAGGRPHSGTIQACRPAAPGRARRTCRCESISTRSSGKSNAAAAGRRRRIDSTLTAGRSSRAICFCECDSHRHRDRYAIEPHVAEPLLAGHHLREGGRRGGGGGAGGGAGSKSRSAETRRPVTTILPPSLRECRWSCRSASSGSRSGSPGRGRPKRGCG